MRPTVFRSENGLERKHRGPALAQTPSITREAFLSTEPGLAWEHQQVQLQNQVLRQSNVREVNQNPGAENRMCKILGCDPELFSDRFG